MNEHLPRSSFPESDLSERERNEQHAARIIEANKNHYGREGIQNLLKRDSELSEEWTDQGYAVPFFSGLDQNGNMIKIMAQPEERVRRGVPKPDSLIKVLYGDDQREITIPGPLRTHDMNYRGGGSGHNTLYNYEGMIAGFQRAALEEDVTSEEIARFGALKQQIDASEDMDWLRQRFGNRLRGVLGADHRPREEQVPGEKYSAYLATTNDDHEQVSAVSLVDINAQYVAEDQAALEAERQRQADYEQAWQMHERATAHVKRTVKKKLFESAEKLMRRENDAFREAMDKQLTSDSR